MLGWTSSTKRLVESPEAEKILCLNGLNGLDDVFRVAAHATSRHPDRGVCPIELRDLDGGKFTAYFKLNWGRPRWWPRITDIKTRQAFQSLVLHEWQGLERMKSHGFKVPQRLALFEEGGRQQRAAIIIRSVAPQATLSDMIRNLDWISRPESERTSLIEAALGILGRIYGLGLAWRGASSRHLFPERDACGAWTMWLIDCEGIHPRSSSTLARDVDRFLRSVAVDHRKRSQKTRGSERPAVIDRAAA